MACAKGARRYKQAYIKKQISLKNQQERAKYGQKYQGLSIDDFWHNIVYTDECHIDPSSLKQGFILREEGTRYNTENIQQRPEKKGVRLHIAAWINWHAKADKIEFYNDEREVVRRPPRAPKPRKSKYEAEDQFQYRLLEWEAALPHPQEIKPKGNAMTQKYYTERLLPVYITTIQKARIERGQNWVLQEDNDPSHGSRRRGLAQLLKEANWIENQPHPAQSPDLNPIEGIWNIIKQRLRYKVWNDLNELKQAIQGEWDRVTMQQIRKRISDIPRRCEQLVKTSGGPIKTALW